MLETIAGESEGSDCYLELFAYITFRHVVSVMVKWPMVAELIVAGYINKDLLRKGRVALAMLGFRTSPHTFYL